MENTKHTLSYGVFWIYLLKKYYLLENYDPFIGENILITRFDFSDVPKNQFSSLNKIEENKNKKNKKDNKPLSKDEKEKKVNKISDKDEGNYYGGFIPKRKNR